MTEIDLANIVINKYNLNFEIYQEVEVPSGYIDIIGVNKIDNSKIAIEVKKVFNFKLLEQGIRCKSHANYVYLAIPRCRDLEFRARLCKDYGLGLLLISTDGIYEYIKPKYNDIKKDLRLSVYQKNNVAGSQHHRITNFDITKLNIINFLKNNDGIYNAKELISSIEHHYANNTSCLQSIKKWITKGVITEFYYEKNKLILTK